MTETQITANDLLAGANASFRIEVPAAVLRPGDQETSANGKQVTVELRPLTVGAFQLILKAADEDPGVIPLLMIREALVEPKMTLAQVGQMHLGLVEFLVGHIRRISGMDEKKKLKAEGNPSPLLWASYVLAREFGWTPAQVQALTMGQIGIYLEMHDQYGNGEDGSSNSA